MTQKKRSRLIPALLIILPLWLVASAGFALVKYFKDEKETAAETGQRFQRGLSTEDIGDDLRKIVNVIGERNTAQPEKLAATASMIEGLLGPANTGYAVKRIKGPAQFPILQVTIPASGKSENPLWILTSYDSPPGSPGADKNASGLAATLAAAQSLANESPAHPIHFVFLPHANDPDSPVLETALKVSGVIRAAPTPEAILCVEAMGAAESLIMSSRDTTALPTAEFSGLGKILGAEVTCLGDDFDLASTLFEMDLPAIRIATRATLLPDEKDDKVPFAPTVTASTGRLVELIRKLAK